MSWSEDLSVLEAIEDVIARIQALAAHPGLTRCDAKAIKGSLGPFRFLRTKHRPDGRTMATPRGDREDAPCRGN
jgi:hypothetical protein